MAKVKLLIVTLKKKTASVKIKNTWFGIEYWKAEIEKWL